MSSRLTVSQRADLVWKNHKTEILRDDGLYRHIHVTLNVKEPWPTWVDVVTWPGYLSITGDLSDGWTFTREPDMLRDFFHASKNASTGNTWLPIDYWAEKLTDTGRRACRKYDEDTWLEWALSVIAEAEEHGDLDQDTYSDTCHAARIAAPWEHSAMTFTQDTLIDWFSAEWEDARIDTYTDDYVRSCHLIHRIAREYRETTQKDQH